MWAFGDQEGSKQNLQMFPEPMQRVSRWGFVMGRTLGEALDGFFIHVGRLSMGRVFEERFLLGVQNWYEEVGKVSCRQVGRNVGCYTARD